MRHSSSHYQNFLLYWVGEIPAVCLLHQHALSYWKWVTLACMKVLLLPSEYTRHQIYARCLMSMQKLSPRQDLISTIFIIVNWSWALLSTMYNLTQGPSRKIDKKGCTFFNLYLFREVSLRRIFTPGSCTIQAQFDLLTAKQLHWSS